MRGDNLFYFSDISRQFEGVLDRKWVQRITGRKEERKEMLVVLWFQRIRWSPSDHQHPELLDGIVLNDKERSEQSILTVN